MNSCRLATTALLAATFTLAVASPARADGAATKPGGAASTAGSSSGLMDEAQRWLRAASAGGYVASEPSTNHGGSDTPMSTTAERSGGDKRGSVSSPAFLDLSPHASLVARDWRGSMRLVGNRTMLVDELRPTASSRMVMARVATDARLSAFAQVGLGEWRLDTVMFPNARADSEMAAQLGVGFELLLPRGMRVAGEAQYTMLARDLHYSTEEVAPRMAAFVLAFAGHF